MMRYPLVVWGGALTGILIAFVTTSAQASISTLNDALASAYVNNRALAAERAALRATDEKLPQANAAWRPTVTINASQGISHCQGTQEQGKYPGISAAGVCDDVSIPPTYSGSNNLSPETYGLTVSLPLYRGGRDAARDEAVDQIQSGRAKLISTEQTVLFATVSDYMDVVLAQTKLALDDNDVDVVRHQWDLTREQAHVGEVTDTDVKQAEAALAQAIAQREETSGTLQQSVAALAHDIGVSPDSRLAPAQAPIIPQDRDAVVDRAGRHNPEVVAAQYDQLATGEDIKAIRGDLLPVFSLDASIGRSKETQRAGLQEDRTALIAELSIPLYEGGATYSRAREAQQTREQQLSLLDDARLTAMQSAAQYWDAMMSAKASMIALNNEIDADATALDGVEHEEAVGTRTVQDVLIAEQTLLTARTNLAQAQHDATLAAYGIRAATGDLTAEALGTPIDASYDPETHLDSVRNKWFGFGATDGPAPKLDMNNAAARLATRPPASESSLFDVPPPVTPVAETIASPEIATHRSSAAAAPELPLVSPTDFDHSSDPPAGPDKWMDSSRD